LLYSISGLETNVAGEILVKGENLLTMKQRDRERLHQLTIGMIFQAFYLIPSLSVIDNIALPQVALNRRRSERSSKAMKLMEKFLVAKQAYKLPTELSGGQQQRVAICRSVMNNPDILLADEPVGNLDSKSSEEVMKLLRELNDRDGKTVILVSHDPSHLHHAHRVFFMRDGQVIRVQKNTEAERRQSPVIAAAEQSMQQKLLEWAKTVSPDANESQHQLADLLRSQEILDEVFTGIAAPDMRKLEQAVAGYLVQGAKGKRTLERLLLRSEEKGGLGLSSARGAKILRSIVRSVTEVRRLALSEKHLHGLPDEKRVPREAANIRKTALKTLKAAMRTPDTYRLIDAIIAERLKGEIDHLLVYRKLRLPKKKGGAGCPAHLARLLTHQIESLILSVGIDTSKKQSEKTKENAVPEAAPEAGSGTGPIGQGPPADPLPAKQKPSLNGSPSGTSRLRSFVARFTSTLHRPSSKKRSS
jgi:putative ABC transport system ATP-binding protein